METQPFLLAGIALIAVGIPAASLSVIPFIGAMPAGILGAISTFAAPAVLVVAFKEFYVPFKGKTEAGAPEKELIFLKRLFKKETPPLSYPAECNP